ncbi:MAG: serine/threonine-protein phosphatase [Edaphobacter sp.]|nr:serine/threonine-protein phosphatase [Edaphobacter sp.]
MTFSQPDKSPDRRCSNSNPGFRCCHPVCFPTEGPRENSCSGSVSFPFSTELSLSSETLPFRLGFGLPEGIELAVERLVSLSTSVPGLLLFEEFYGLGGRSSIRWRIGGYCPLVAVALTGVLAQSPLELIPAPGIVLAIMVPFCTGRGTSRRDMPPLLPNSRVLFAGLLAFFCALSFDRPLHPGISNWHPGAEPFGFLLTDEMRAATRIQEAILPRAILSLKDV